MKWRTFISVSAVVAVMVVRLFLGTPTTPTAHADELIPTHTPTATPPSGTCTDYLCG